MRILLIAYEFPPSASPQSIRWKYLTQELVKLGCQIDVITTTGDHTRMQYASMPMGVHTHQSSAGWLHEVVTALRTSKKAAEPSRLGEDKAYIATPHYHLNWKGRALAAIRLMIGWISFPDARAQWKRPAVDSLRKLLISLRPDVVISSHEPATTLELGLIAKEIGFKWIADLGDPVCAPYTPMRWRLRAKRLERLVCNRADAVVVTNEATAKLLKKRHGLAGNHLHLIRQGFDSTSLAPVSARKMDRALVDLLYTGSLYDFRRIDNLIEAISCVQGVRLTVASLQLPKILRNAVEREPSRFRYLGFIEHEQARRRQWEADILISLANQDACQTPGKFFEYLGTGKPILHLTHDRNSDECAQILERSCGGWVSEFDPNKIASLLARLVDQKGDYESVRAPDLDYSWTMLAKRYAGLCEGVI